jgi:ubiquinone/menaquinone biosynthesis C-methylase UbiE
MLKLNLGSDMVRHEGYLSVDISAKCQPDILADVTSLPFEDNTVDEIYASHIIEHVSFDWDVIAEWKRVLVVGGLLSVMAPDFLKLYNLYRTGFIDERYFQATIFGAQLLGFREEFAHQQVFSDVMLLERVQAHFPDAELVDICPVRFRNEGEAMVVAHKE